MGSLHIGNHCEHITLSCEHFMWYFLHLFVTLIIRILWLALEKKKLLQEMFQHSHHDKLVEKYQHLQP